MRRFLGGCAIVLIGMWFLGLYVLAKIAEPWLADLEEDMGHD